MPLGAVNLPASLDDVRVKKLPPSSYYIADFISEEEERLILQKVRKTYFDDVCQAKKKKL